MPTITPFLWFDNNLEEAMAFYKSVFKNVKIGHVSRIDGTPSGQVTTASFEIEGQPFMALNGGPEFKFTEAVSFYVNCETQKEIDYYWERLTADGGEESMCGWLKDKFGLSWQIIPSRLGQLIGDPDPQKA